MLVVLLAACGGGSTGPSTGSLAVTVTGLPGGTFGAIVAVMLLMFVLGFVLDFIEIVFVVVPIVGPVLLALGVDPVWLGVMMAINLQTSFLTPPFGFALFYLRGIAPPSIKSSEIYWGALPWLGLQIVLVAILIFWPEMVTYWLDAGPTVDPNSIQIEIPNLDDFSAPPIPAPSQ